MKRNIFRFGTALIVFLLAFLFFYSLLFSNVETDIQLHAKAIQQVNRGEANYSPGFLYFFIISLCSFFSTDLNVLYITSAWVIALAVTAKFIITQHIFIRYFEMNNIPKTEKIEAVFILTSFCMLFIFSLPDLNFYLSQKYCFGKIPPNVWHSGTLIFLFPFALLLFWKQYEMLRSTDKRARILPLIILVCINILIKPSFFFVYAIVTPVMLVFRKDAWSDFSFNMIPIGIGLVLLSFLYVFIYPMNIGSLHHESSGIAITIPFEIWAHFINPMTIPMALAASFTLPIAYFVLHKKNWIDFTLLERYILYMLLAGLLIYICISETGPRKFHGNFAWQNILVCYLLMLGVSMESMVLFYKKGSIKWKEKLMFTLFSAHVLSGIAYIVKIFYSGNYC